VYVEIKREFNLWAGGGSSRERIRHDHITKEEVSTAAGGVLRAGFVRGDRPAPI